MKGLWRGTSLALVGVSNGAVQFMAYEEMKRWGFERKAKQFADAGRTLKPEDDKLVRFEPCCDRKNLLKSLLFQSNTAYTMMSGISKLWALALTYPYQVIRSRIQVSCLVYLTY